MATFEPSTEAFFEAIKTGDVQALEALLTSSPDLVHARTTDSIGPVALAKYYREDRVASFLIERGADLDPFTATIVGREDVIRPALKNNPGIIWDHSPDGWTLLHLAAYFGHREIAEALIDAGADIEARSANDQGNMPLHAALPNRHLDVVELLLAHGADVNSMQQGGLTPLHEAALIGDLTTARMLVDRGANLRAKTDDGETPLDLAVKRKQREVAGFLRAQSAGRAHATGEPSLPLDGEVDS